MKQRQEEGELVPNHSTNDNIIAKTSEFWYNKCRVQVSHEEAREACENISGFFQVLAEWDNRRAR